MNMLNTQSQKTSPLSSSSKHAWRLPSSVKRIQGEHKRQIPVCRASVDSQSQAVSRRRLAQLGVSGAILLGGSNRAGASEEETQVRSDNADGATEAEGAPSGKINNDRGGPRSPLPPVPKAALRKLDKQSPPLEVSKIIKGCWQLDGEHKGNPKTDRTSGSAAMTDFERFNSAGITTVDTADIYGPSESQIGQYLRLYPWRKDEMQICTKVTIMEEDVPQLTQDLLEYRVRRSMARLGVSSLDLVQLHWENFEQQGTEVRSLTGSRKMASSVDAAKWLADLQGRGLIRGVGLTNFDVPHLLQIVDAGVEVASHQVQYSVLDRRPELYMMDLCEKRGIPIIAYGTLSGGWLSEAWARKPARKAALDTMSKAKYGPQLKEMGGWAWLQEVLAALTKVGRKHGVSASAVAVNWALQQPSVAAAAVGARNALHMRDLQTVFTFSLDEDDLLEIDAAYEGSTKQPTSDVFAWERGGVW
mmetsp:Transcript_13721/g.37050  ORF Transcript_13721/g.37050 Transcript_13721/m.37050 type:complete len:473 (+) Transcript_13721:142-1560(+)